MITLKAFAKINLFLEVMGKRADGFHEIETCMIPIDLADQIAFWPDEEVTFTCDHPDVPTDETNLILKAVRLLQAHAKYQGGVGIRMEKRIPMAAGLGGGSSDAALTLRALNELWQLHLPHRELLELASQLGSDVPFFLFASPAWCTGRGEIVAPFTLEADLHFVLLCPNQGCSTAEVYRRLTLSEPPRSSQAMRDACSRGDSAAIGAAMWNRLEAPATALWPELSEARQWFATHGPALGVLGHQLSGSGSTYFALLPDANLAWQCADALRASFALVPGQDDSGLSLFVVGNRRSKGV